MLSPIKTPLKSCLKNDKSKDESLSSYGCVRECLEPGDPDAEPESMELLEEYLENMSLWTAQKSNVNEDLKSPKTLSSGIELQSEQYREDLAYIC